MLAFFKIHNGFAIGRNLRAAFGAAFRDQRQRAVVAKRLFKNIEHAIHIIHIKQRRAIRRKTRCGFIAKTLREFFEARIRQREKKDVALPLWRITRWRSITIRSESEIITFGGKHRIPIIGGVGCNANFVFERRKFQQINIARVFTLRPHKHHRLPVRRKTRRFINGRIVGQAVGLRAVRQGAINFPVAVAVGLKHDEAPIGGKPRHHVFAGCGNNGANGIRRADAFGNGLGVLIRFRRIEHVEIFFDAGAGLPQEKIGFSPAKLGRRHFWMQRKRRVKLRPRRRILFVSQQ